MTQIAGLFPGYFALVMATGIVSIGAYLMDMPRLAWVLVYLNVAAYVVLVCLLLVRVVRFLPHIIADIKDNARGAGFFTVVAGTCVLGSQLLIVAGVWTGPFILWIAGIILWAVVMYAFFSAITVKEDKPPLEKGINGAWLIAVVATQSISKLGTLLAPQFGAAREGVLFFTLCMFLIGCMLYLMLITLIFYRFTFYRLTSENLTPPYWINMGAVAITTLAGARLIIAGPESEVLAGFVPFIKGFTLFFWAVGTWWIPMLIILGIWRHIVQRFPLRYDPQYWGMVFPLGMYTVCTYQLSKALGYEPLMYIPRVVIWFALAAWIATFFGLLQRLFHDLFFASEKNS
jgi:tellurite resistance protein TehA-like permease